jgi:transposase
MGQKRRKFTREHKISAIRSLESGKTIAEVARENEIHPSLLSKWKKEYSLDPDNAFKGNGNTYKTEARNAELERLVGQLYAENEFLKKALSTLEKLKEQQRRRSGQR